MNIRSLLLWSFVAATCFHLAHELSVGAPLMAGFLYCLLRLAALTQRGLLLGWILGLVLYGPQLGFFWNIFGPAAIALWLVLATWLGLYLALQRFALLRLPGIWGFAAAPMLWVGLEYFRSELYYLRFSWLNAGYAFAPIPALSPVPALGMYGTGFVLMSIAAFIEWWRLRQHSFRRLAVGAALSLLALVTLAANRMAPTAPGSSRLKVAGAQLEFETDDAIRRALDSLLAAHSDADLFVLSEYTFDGRVPQWVNDWCARHRRYLLLGGKRYLDPAETRFHNTAFVIGPDGNVVFEQAKSVPIQFFNDGLPAARQSVWRSPWGKLGICICYDLSYTRVTDQLIELGAQALIVPTMDVTDWGERQHRLHGRVAPTRAAEHGVPVFRLCSSGISQAVNAQGEVVATAPFPGQGEMLAATLDLPAAGRRPLDRWLAWPCIALAGLMTAWHLLASFRWNPRRAG